jgi:molecular chaperone HscB
VNAHSNTAMPAAFLMQQMQWREDLEDAVSAAALETLSADVAAAEKTLLQQCENLLDAQHDYVQAVAVVRCLMFIDKFREDLAQRFDAFE